MSLTNENGLSAADVAAVMGGSGHNGGYGWGDGSFWIIVLFLFAFMGNGWGNGYGGNGTAPLVMNTANDVQRGFDQASIMSSLGDITGAINNGFANAEVSRCNASMNLFQTLSAMQMAQQQCCCENRAGIADLKYTIATEACADRAAVKDGVYAITTNQSANTQAIMDKLCQLELDGFKQRNADLLAENSALKFAQSQTAQTAQILANNEAQTAALERYLAPNPIPAYVVQNPNCCGPTYGSACGCGM